MSKDKSGEIRVAITIQKYLEMHGQGYERMVVSMLKKKYRETKKTVSEWGRELSEFRNKKVNL